MDAFWLGAVIGASMPGISGERTLKDNATGPTLTTTGKASSEHHYAMDGVVEGGFSVKGFDLSLGLNGGWLTYQGMIVNTPPGGPPATARDDIRDNINIGGYVGVQKKLEAHNLTMAVGEATNFYMVTNEPDVIDAFTYDPGKTTANTINFYFAGSVEKEWSSLKWLDAVIGRAALSYGVNTIIGHEDGAAAGSSHELRQRLVTGRTGLGLTMGLGVRKGVFGVDVNVAPLAVLNAFKLVTGNYAANDLGTITLNLDFGTLKTKSGSADIESAPTPVPRGATPSTTPAF
jgi:hypothetical protein